MRAITISAHGGLDQVEYRDDLPAPRLVHPTDVLIRVQGAALNHLDLFQVEGLPGITIKPPWILGTDGCGIVEEVGAEVSHVKPGDLVVVNPGISDRTCEYCLDGEHPLCLKFGILGEHLPGFLAEQIVVPMFNVLSVPSHTPIAEAAAFTLATLTAYRMLTTRAQLKAGEHVLIWGIGGGVALACLQIAKLLGARVTVTSSSDEKLARARTIGADDTINYRTMDVGKEVRARTAKRGVDVVVDSVGQDTWQQSLVALGRRGRLVTCGGTSGPMVTTDVRRLFWNQWNIMGSTMGNDREFAAIVEHFRAGQLRPIVDTVFPLERGQEAFEHLASATHFGKVVVTI